MDLLTLDQKISKQVFDLKKVFEDSYTELFSKDEFLERMIIKVDEEFGNKIVDTGAKLLRSTDDRI